MQEPNTENQLWQLCIISYTSKRRCLIPTQGYIVDNIVTKQCQRSLNVHNMNYETQYILFHEQNDSNSGVMP